MANLKFFVDTNALNYLAGLKGSDLQDFKTRIETSNSELSATHMQVDEMHEDELKEYQQKIEKALGSLTNKGIVVHVEPTKIFVLGISRLGYGVLGSEEIGKLYDKLRKEIDECEKAKEGIKPPLNIACDAAIAVSSLDHDFFIT